MSRYIDADNAKAIYLSKSAGEQLDRVPTADVQEVKHAKRIDGYYRQLCSNCKHRVHKTSNYCSYCGAKMEGYEK